MYRVFLIHNTLPDEMVIVWRLQTLAAASGLHLEVPNDTQRQNPLLISQMIDAADSVMVLLTERTLESGFVISELNEAISKKRTIIPIVVKGVAHDALIKLMSKYGSPVFIIDPQKPWIMEKELSAYLLKKVGDKNARNALLALAGTLGGLFLLSKLSENG
jgi:hypothetical protein